MKYYNWTENLEDITKAIQDTMGEMYKADKRDSDLYKDLRFALALLVSHLLSQENQ